MYAGFLDRWSRRANTEGDCGFEPDNSLRSDCGCATASDSAGTRLFQHDHDVNASTPEKCYGFNYSDYMMPTYGYYAYDAVYALAHAAQIVIDEGGSEFTGAAIREALKKVSFQGVTGTVEFMDNGDREVGVGSAILNHDGLGDFSPLGSWTREAGFVYGEGRTRDGIVWPSSTGEQPSGVIILGEESARGGFSKLVVFAIFGGALILLLLVMGCNKVKQDQLVKEKKEVVVQNEKAKLENAQLNTTMVRLKKDVELLQAYSNAEISMLEDKIALFTEDMKVMGENSSYGVLRGMEKLLIKANELVGKEVVGKGSFGEVYKSDYRGSTVAVKTMKVIDEEGLTRFQAEILLMADLHHQNIVTMVGCCWEKDLMALVMEFCEKGMASEVLKTEGHNFTWDDP